MDVERLADIAHACPSGAIRYKRRDGRPDESHRPSTSPPIREAGPYAFRGGPCVSMAYLPVIAPLCVAAVRRRTNLSVMARTTMWASTPPANPPTGTADALAVRDGPLHIEPQTMAR